MKYKTAMDLLQNIGVFPLPPQLSVSNVVKGYIILYFLSIFFKLNFLFSDILLAAIITIYPTTFFCTLRSSISQLFWKAMMNLIGKRKIKIKISGVDFKEKVTLQQLKSCVVISNHRSLFDYILIHYLKTMVEDATNEQVGLSFFSWNLFWNIPGLKLLYQIFINDENWKMDSVKLETNIHSLVKGNRNNWLIHFPEVNIFTEQNRMIQNLQTDKFLVPKFNNLLYPRFSNFNNLIKLSQGVNGQLPKFTHILDLSIIYFNPFSETFTCPTLFEIFTLKQPNFIVHVDFKLKPINKLPNKLRKLEKWLENDWQEKENILELIQKEIKLKN